MGVGTHTFTREETEALRETQAAEQEWIQLPSLLPAAWKSQGPAAWRWRSLTEAEQASAAGAGPRADLHTLPA